MGSRSQESPAGLYRVEVAGVEEQLALWSVRPMTWTYQIDEHYLNTGSAYRTHFLELEASNRAVRTRHLFFEIQHRHEGELLGIELLVLSKQDWTSGSPPRLSAVRGHQGYGPLELKPGKLITSSELVATQVPPGSDPDLDPYDVGLGTDIDLPGNLSWDLLEIEISYVGELLERSPEDLLGPKMSQKRIRSLQESLRLHGFDWG
jgi:hypothetical protein